MIVRAIDVGFRWTKAVLGYKHSEMITLKFPSRVAQPASTNLAVGPINCRDTVTVTVNDRLYEVGHDVETILRADNALVLDDQFSQSDIYLALVRGMLCYISDNVIDLLVVGLPVNQMCHSAALIQRLKTIHPLPGGRNVNVNNVQVVPQPLGGFFYHANEVGFSRLKTQRTLVVDPGFFTLDWVLMRGMVGEESRSGTYQGGVFKILQSIAETITKERRSEYKNLYAIDHGLRNPVDFRIAGKSVDIARYYNQAAAYIDEAISKLRSSVGNGDDIDHIAMVGGGSQIFMQSLERAFPSHKIQIIADGLMANVKGFQLIGEVTAARKLSSVA